MNHFSLIFIYSLLLSLFQGTVIQVWNKKIILTYQKCNYNDQFQYKDCFSYHQEVLVQIINEYYLLFILNHNEMLYYQQENIKDLLNLDFYFLKDQESYIQSISVNQNPLSICGDTVISGDEECDDGNHFPFDGCFNCKYQCEQFCLICIQGNCIQKDELGQFGERMNEIKEIYFQQQQITYLLEDDEIQCILKCRICINKKCILCNDGYYINDITNVCETNCGDNILQGLEECDDGNKDNYDGCSQCKLVKYDKCNQEEQNYCSICHYGQCLQCLDGYFLHNSVCTFQCGDGLVNKFEKEKCDNPFEKGCIQCQIAPGYLCVGPTFSICLTCDQNCEENECFNINDNLICKKCKKGYYPVDKYCKPCDSNCITCQNERFLCTSCFRNDCDFCESYIGLYTDTNINACVSICGDGILIKESEQCDDGNQDDDDGCDSTCHLEGQTIDYSSFQKIESSGLNSFQFKMESESQKFTLDCDNVIVTIDSYDSKQFQFQLINNDENCEIQFKFLKSIYKHNKIHVVFTFQEIKSRLLLTSQSQNTIQFDIEPKEQIIKSDNELQQSDSISSAQQSFGLIFLILIPISIITNLFDYLWAILEILSWINNFYFLNVHYPFNIEVFFLNADWTSIFNFPTYQGFNQPDCEYYFKAPLRFETKGINPLFLNNAQIPFMFLFSAIVIYFIMYSIYLILFWVQQRLRGIKNSREKQISIFNLENIQYEGKKKIKQNKNKKKKKDEKDDQNFLNKIIKLLNSVQKELKKKIKQTISLCLLDITLAIMLQLSYAQNLDYFIVLINQLLAIISSSLIIFHLHKSYQTVSIHKQLAENQFFKENHEIYYENVNTDSDFGSKYKFIGLLRKIFYIFFMVYFYNYPLLQTQLCFVTSNLGLALILYENPYKTKAQFTFQFISDFCLSSILFIAVLFAFNDQKQIQFIENNKVIFGWIMIALVFIALLVEIIVLFYQLTLSFFQMLKLFREISISQLKKPEINQKDIEIENQIDNSSQQQQQQQQQSIIQNDLFVNQFETQDQYKIISQIDQSIQQIYEI